MSQKRQDLLGKLTQDEMQEFGLHDNQLDTLHDQLGIVEEEEYEEEEVEEEYDEEEVEEEEPEPVPAPVKKKTTKKAPTKRKAPAKPKNNVRDMLRNITIDLNNIEFSDKSPLEKIDDIEFMLNGKPTFQIVANQSAYSAHMESIKLADISSLTNSTADQYAAKQRLYKTVYDKINTTNLGKVNYKTWLKITSFFDLPTFMYGMYCQTFPGDTTFEIRCRHCGEATEVIVNNDTLVDVKDEQTYGKLQEIIRNARKPEDIIGDSLVNKFTRTVLPQDKIMLEVQTPSLWDHLELLGSVDQGMLEEMQDVIGTMLFIKNMYVVDIAHLQQTGKVKYSKVDDRNQQVRILRNLDLEDAKAMGEAIGERSDKYAIGYKIKDHNCNKCEKSIGEIPVDMEEMLFTQILQM
jgi:hypothetical protein